MTSLFALTERRGMVLYVVLGALLVLVVLHELFFPVLETTPLRPADLYSRSHEAFAQFISVIIWLALCTLVALIYVRVFFHVPHLWEVVAGAGIVGVALFPIFFVVAAYALRLLSLLGGPSRVLEAPHSGYALAMLFMLLIVGVIFLVGREGIRASRSNNARHAAV